MLTPPGEEGTVKLWPGLEQRTEHLAQAVGGKVAEQFSLVGNSDLTKLLTQDQYHGVGLHGLPNAGAMPGSHPFPHAGLVGYGLLAVGCEDLVATYDHVTDVVRR